MSRCIVGSLLAALLVAAVGLAIVCSAGECGRTIGTAMTRQATGLLAPAEIGFAQQRMTWWE